MQDTKQRELLANLLDKNRQLILSCRCLKIALKLYECKVIPKPHDILAVQRQFLTRACSRYGTLICFFVSNNFNNRTRLNTIQSKDAREANETIISPELP